MSEREIGFKPEVIQPVERRERELVRLWENGMLAPDCVGYHATTLETIQHLIREGSIPGHTGPDSERPHLPQKGDIYFFPCVATFPFEKLPQLLGKNRINPALEEFGLKMCVDFGSTWARAHAFCSYLGLDITKYGDDAWHYTHEDDSAEVILDESETEAVFENLPLDGLEITRAYLAARKRKGLVIGLKRSALDTYPLSEGDEALDISQSDKHVDFRLSPGPKGLPLDALSGILPLAEDETAFLDSLKVKHYRS